MEADYVLAHFQLMPQSVKELEAEISASEDILRYLVVKVSDWYGKLEQNNANW